MAVPTDDDDDVEYDDHGGIIRRYDSDDSGRWCECSCD
jgi:hypothetical protein